MYSSCSEEDTSLVLGSSEYFKILGDTIVIPADATSAKFNISSENQWSIVVDKNYIEETTGIAKVWSDLQVTPNLGQGNGIVKITTSTNDGRWKREARLWVKTLGGISKKITVRQLSIVDFNLSVNDKVTFGLDGGTNIISVTSNTKWTVTGGSDWCTFSVNDDATKTGAENNGYITVRVPTNPSTATRTATITVTPEGGKAQSFTVEQNDKVITLSASPLSLSFAAVEWLEKSIGIVCNDDWSIVASNDWVRLSTLSGNGNDNVYVYCEPNETGIERSATLIVQSGGKSVTVSVWQEAGQHHDQFLVVSPEHLTFKASASEEHEISILCENMEWTAVSSDSWLHLSELKGYGEGHIIAYCDMNDTPEDRWGYIRVESGGQEKVIEVTQLRAEPVVFTTPQVISKDKYMAVVSFSFSSEIPVSIYGVCYSKDNEHPDKDSDHASKDDKVTQGTPTLELMDLTPGTTYFMRAFAITATGVEYSNTVEFTTLSGKPGEDDNVTP